MTKKEKLVENTILALQGRLVENSNYSYKPTSNSDYARSIAKRTKFNSQEYVDNIYRSNPLYDIYEEALQNLNKELVAQDMFIDDVQIMTSHSGLLGLVAICKNEVTKDFEYSSYFESGVFIHVDKDTKEISYRFAVKKPEEMNVISKNQPSNELIKAVKTYLFLLIARDKIIYELKRVLRTKVPNLYAYPVHSYEPSYYTSVVCYGDNHYKCEVFVIPNKKNYTYEFKFKNKEYTDIDEVVKDVEEDYNKYINSTEEEKITENKLNEVTNNSNIKEAKDDLLRVLQNIERNYGSDYRYKTYGCNINGDTIKIYYQTQEDIEEEDAKEICNFIEQYIQQIVNEYGLNVTKAIVNLYDRSGRWENGQLEQTIKLNPGKAKTVSTKTKLSKEQIEDIADTIYREDYDSAYDVVGGADGTIYDYLEEILDPNEEWNLAGYFEDYEIDVNDEATMKAIALCLIKNVCEEEGWSVAQAKEECGY